MLLERRIIFFGRSIPKPDGALADGKMPAIVGPGDASDYRDVGRNLRDTLAAPNFVNLGAINAAYRDLRSMCCSPA